MCGVGTVHGPRLANGLSKWRSLLRGHWTDVWAVVEVCMYYCNEMVSMLAEIDGIVAISQRGGEQYSRLGIESE